MCARQKEDIRIRSLCVHTLLHIFNTHVCTSKRRHSYQALMNMFKEHIYTTTIEQTQTGRPWKWNVKTRCWQQKVDPKRSLTSKCGVGSMFSTACVKNENHFLPRLGIQLSVLCALKIIAYSDHSLLFSHTHICKPIYKWSGSNEIPRIFMRVYVTHHLCKVSTLCVNMYAGLSIQCRKLSMCVCYLVYTHACKI